jgi:predicted Fe-Mo cluster-binding NifX family protein
MNKIAMMVSFNRLDTPLAPTFGKARWLLVVEAEDQVEFRRNDTPSGGAVAATVFASGCRDLIAAHLGDKAFEHLVALGIRVWRGPAEVPVRDLIALHARGELERWRREAGSPAQACRPGGGHGVRPRSPKPPGEAGPDALVRLPARHRGG